MWFKSSRKRFEKENKIEVETPSFFGETEPKEEETEKIEEQEKKELDEAEQKVSKGSQKKKKIMNIVFFIINLAVVGGLLAYQLTKEAFVPLEGLNISLIFILVLIACTTVVELLDSVSISYLVKKDTNEPNEESTEETIKETKLTKKNTS